MMQLRHIARSVLCCLLCLTVCAVPALAGKLDTIGGVVLSEQDTFAITYQTTGGVNSVVYPFNSVPASFEFVDGTYIYRWESNLPYDYAFDRISKGGKVFEVMVNVSDRVGPVNVSFDSFSALPLASSDVNSAWKMNGVCELLVDNVSVWSTTVTDGNMPAAPNWQGLVEGYFSIRYTFTSDCSSGIFYAGYEPQLLISIPNLMVENESTVLDEISLSLKNIEGDVETVRKMTTQINMNVSQIRNGLQNSNSTIWGSFKDSVSGLFVPSSGDLEGVKNGFDQLAQDKLGGAYQTVDMVSGGVQSVSDKLKNPGSSPGVEFPGISVPLGGDVGTVTLAASQTVAIPEKITGVLYPVSGVIIPIVCTIWTVRLGLDMVNCFMSGMSYAEFLHRHTSKEDEEV